MTNPHKQSAEDKIVSSIEEVLRIELCDFSDESGEYYRTDTVKRLIYSFAKQEVKKACEEQREREMC